MKIEDNTVTFRFYFRGMTSKAESLKTLQSFLHEKEWLPNDSDYDLELLEYHTDNNGLCEVILKEIKDTQMEELAEIFFADILKNKNIFHVSVLYNEHTDKLVQTHAGKYLSRQKAELSNLDKLNEVVILHRN